jgi:hypothetical protein
MLILPPRWSRGQFFPGGLPRINWAHPLARGLTFYGYDTGAGVYDLVTGQMGTPYNGTPGIGVHPYGRGYLYGSAGITFPSSPTVRAVTATNVYSVVASCVITQTAVSNPGLFGRSANLGASPYANWIVDINRTAPNNKLGGYVNYNGGANAIELTGGTTPINTLHTVSLTLSGTTMVVAQNGVLIGGAIQTGGPASAPGSVDTQDNIYFGVFASATPTSFFNGFLPYGGFWSRVLSLSESQMLHLDPTCFLIFPEDDIAALGGAVRGRLLHFTWH